MLVSRLACRLVVLASVAGLSLAQNMNDLDPCAQDCINSVLGNGAELGCEPNAADCLCVQPEFGYGIRDCALQACPESVVAQATNYATALCATATLATTAAAEPTPTKPPGETATTTVDQTTERPSPSAAPQSTATEGEDPSATELPPRTSSKEPGTGMPEPSSTEPATNSGTQSASNRQSGDATEASGQSSGLSTGAKVGIGVGTTVAGILLLALGFFAMTVRFSGRGRRNSKVSHMSGPMPGSGGNFGDGRSELESRSRRYEDMLPRRQPQTV